MGRGEVEGDRVEFYTLYIFLFLLLVNFTYLLVIISRR